jgi:CHAT domain-containing protein/tetratricopeptide (TPR) repeat protein
MRWKKALKYLGLACSITLLTVLLGLGIFPTTAQLTATEIALSNAPTTQSLSSNPFQLVQQGKEHYQSGEFTGAVTLWQQAAAAFAEQGDNLNQAMVLSNLALAYQELGNWPQADGAIATSLELLRTEHQGNITDRLKILAQAWNTQGSLQLAQGKTEDAIASWQKAADTYQQIGDEQGHLQSTINQAQALKTAGLFPRACKILLPSELKDQDCRTITLDKPKTNQKQTNTLTELLDTLQKQPDTLTQVARLLNLGDTLRLVGKPEASEKVLQLSLAMAQRLQSPSDESATLLSLGNTQQVLARKACDASTDSDISKEKIEEAQKFYYQKALDNYQQAATTATSPIRQTQAQLNRLSLLVNTHESGTSYSTEECKKQVREWSRDQDLGLAQIQNQLERLPWNRPAIYARINFAQNLIALRKQENTTPHSPFPTSSDIAQILTTAGKQAKELGDFQAQSYALGYLGQLYEQTQQWTPAQDLTQQALNLAQVSPAPDTIAYRWEWQLGRISKAQAKTPDFKEAIAYYHSAFNRLQILRQDLAVSDPDLQFSFRDKTEEPLYLEYVDLLLRPENRSQDKDNLKQARKVIESLQILALENFLQEPCAKADPKSLDEVVENSTAAVIYPIILPDRLEIILKLPGEEQLQHYSSNVKQDQIEELLNQLQQDLRTEYKFDEVKERSQQLYQWLLVPIEKRLKAENIDTLVFVLNGSLQTIPMAALYDGEKYLIEKYAVAVSLGLTIPEPKPLPKERLKVLAAGLSNPPEDLRKEFGKLAFVEQELKTIQKAGVSATLLCDHQKLCDKNFTTPAFNKVLNESAFPVIHLATHGQFSSNPENTFILVADKKININELGNLFRARGLNRPDAIELLILSACETASGDKRAPLGIAGTTLRAGARSAIATLWTVDDQASVTFTKAFYSELLKPDVTKAQALQKAQLALKKMEKYEHPRHWASYILTGNWL